MPSTTVSHAVVRSVSVTSDEPPEKFVRYVSKHEYKVGMNIYTSYEENEYLAAASTGGGGRKPSKSPVKDSPVVKDSVPQEKDEDSDDSD